MSYNKNTDYQSLINKAVSSGNNEAAAYYEQRRNEKIAGEGLKYGQTSNYSQYTDKVTPSYAKYLDDGYNKAPTTWNDDTLATVAPTISQVIKQYEAQKNYDAANELRQQWLYSKDYSTGKISQLPQYDYRGMTQDQYSKLLGGGNNAVNTLGELNIYGGANSSGGTVKTNYIDKNGNSKSGVTSTAMDYYNNMLSKLESQHQSAVAANDATYAAQLEQAMANIQKQKDALNLSYDNAAKQLYIDRRKTEKTTPQALAAQGYNGGLTESSLLGIQNGYEQNLLNNEQNRTTGLSDLSYEGINQQSQNAIAKAQAAAELENNYYTNYANVMAQLASQQNYENEQAYQQQQDTYSRLLQEKQLAASQQSASQENYQNALSYIVSAKKAGYGVTAAQLASAFGLSQSDAASLISSTGSVGSSSGSGSYAYTGNNNTKKDIAANISSINDYDTAVSYMKNSGVSSGIRSGIMTRNEWARRKASLNKYGTGSAEVNNYDSYKAYVQDYVQYAVNK